MISSIPLFLRYFDSVHRRAMRDVGGLPPEADGWKPATGEDENAWTINKIVGHMAGSRLYFASAFRGEGWVSPPAPDASGLGKWLPVLEDSASEFQKLLAEAPDDWLQRRVQMIDTDGSLAGWRVLAMMVEHDIHHRSQLTTYAGLNGWPVHDIFNRAAETIGERQAEQLRKYRK